VPPPINGIPKPAVHESLAPKYLLVAPVALLIFKAVLAKELLKVLWLKVNSLLTTEVF